MKGFIHRVMLWAALFLLASAVAGAQTFATLYDFSDQSSGAFPVGALVQGEDGNFYGLNGLNIVFKITPTGVLTVLNTLENEPPTAGLVLALDGNFYGTTESGGTSNSGTVFRMTPSGIITTIYSFCSQPNCGDGIEPFAPLIQASDGNLYGTTVYGGTLGYGTVFRIKFAGTLASLHSFDKTSDGSFPFGGLIEATDGNFYGTTKEGGAKNFGTVFRMTKAGRITTLHVFEGPDGKDLESALTEGNDGNFYGTTFRGGSQNQGTVFRMTRSGFLKTIHSFDGEDGSAPSTLIEGTDGNIYGTTLTGFGSGAVGTLFDITSAGVFSVLHVMAGSDGESPSGALVQGTNGIFYGMTSNGGLLTCDSPYGCGTVFSLDMGLGPFAAFVLPAARVGQTGGILGQGFTGTTSVVLNGIPAHFIVVSDTFIRATVPPGATTGYVTVTTPTGVLTSNVPFRVIP